MDMTMKAAETARRNLLQRIERFLDDLARAAREPVLNESLEVQAAFRALKTGSFDEGERAMMRAEKPDVFRTSTLFAPDTKLMGIADLRAELGRVLADAQ